MFGAERSSKMLESWDTSFMPKVTEERIHLSSSAEVRSHVAAAEKLTDNDTETSNHTCVTLKFMGFHYNVLFLLCLLYFLSDWDSDIASLLLQPLPPAAGCRRVKIRPNYAVDELVNFHKLHFENVLQLFMSWLLGLKTKTAPTSWG